MQGGKQPTAEQKRFWSAMVELGCCIYPDTPAEIQHCVGSTTKHNKINIGNWFIIPLCPAVHRLAQRNFTNGLILAYLREQGACDPDDSLMDAQKKLFVDCVMKLRARGCEDLPPAEVMQAIQDYHR